MFTTIKNKKAMENFIPLPNILGNSPATETTVQLFNSVRPVKKDKKGNYLLIAIKPHLNGVIVEKKILVKIKT